MISDHLERKAILYVRQSSRPSEAAALLVDKAFEHPPEVAGMIEQASAEH
jgi:hypothetical protein